MGAGDSCRETSICPPAFIPDHSYEIKFNKKSFPPPPTKWNPTLSEQLNTMRQDCGGNLMFNMYLSGSSFCPVKNYRNNLLWVIFSFFCINCAGCPEAAVLLRCQGRALFSLFNLKARLLFCRKSEILFPGRVSWLLGEETAMREGARMLHALDSDWTGKPMRILMFYFLLRYFNIYFKHLFAVIPQMWLLLTCDKDV